MCVCDANIANERKGVNGKKCASVQTCVLEATSMQKEQPVQGNKSLIVEIENRPKEDSQFLTSSSQLPGMSLFFGQSCPVDSQVVRLAFV